MILENYSSWENLFFNFSKAFKKLEQAVSYIKSDSFNSIKFNPNLNNVLFEIVKEGLIQRFEYTHELAWNVMKDYAEYQGNSTIGGSRDASREAFQMKLFSDGHIWMDMIVSRNKTSHTYNEATAEEIYMKILESYYPAFLEFNKILEEKRNNEQKNHLDL